MVKFKAEEEAQLTAEKVLLSVDDSITTQVKPALPGALWSAVLKGNVAPRLGTPSDPARPAEAVSFITAADADIMGPLHNGHMHGRMTVQLADGTHFDGAVSNSECSGPAVVTHGGKRYFGNLVEGQYDGHGVLEADNNGTNYQGVLLSDKPNVAQAPRSIPLLSRLNCPTPETGSSFGLHCYKCCCEQARIAVASVMVLAPSQ